MARRKQEEYVGPSILETMSKHLTFFFKTLGAYTVTNILYFGAMYLIQGTGYIVYGTILCLCVSWLWCKLRRYRLKDKTKLSYIYVVLVLSCVFQYLLSSRVFEMLYNSLMRIGGSAL